MKFKHKSKNKKDNTTYRSGFEVRVSDSIKIPYGYETLKIPYVKPSTSHYYCPDFVLSNGIIVESKGLFNGKDRKKHLLVKEQNPTMDIRFLFQNAELRLSKESKTTYGAWATKHGFIWAQGSRIPDEWQKQ